MSGRTKSPKQPPMHMASIWSKWDVAVYFLLVLHFIQILVRSGWAFCQRLLDAKVPVPGLAPGWIPGQPYQDLSDSQWRDFRASLPVLAAAMAGFVILSRTVQSVAPHARAAFYVLFAIIFLGVLHGVCTVYVLGLVLAHYAIAKAAAGRPYGLLAVWVWTCGMFCLVRVYSGFPFAMFGATFAPLDHHRGMLRWHIHYNLLVLRMLSFAADMHFMRTKQPPRTRLPPDTPPGPDLDLRARTELPLPEASYSLPAYLAYCLYPPLYIAGPIATFNSFTSQIQAPASYLTPKAIAIYLIRALGCLLTLEWVTHTLWFNAVAKHKLWAALQAAEGRHLSPLDMCLVPWWTMLFVWLKFLVIWRFFRFWALADGMDVPENMTRCICNNYDVVGFWKNWHASYNQWLVRYCYIPMGGAAWRVLNVWPIFTFVAIWHDLEWRMLGWAWLMAFIIAPEMLAKWVGAQPWCIRDKSSKAFRYLCCLAGACNVLLLMAANMVGFVFGLDGIQPFITQVLGQPQFLCVVVFALFCGTQLMFAVRDLEAAKAEQQRLLASKT